MYFITNIAITNLNFAKQCKTNTMANAIKGRHETQHHDTQHNEILHIDTQHKGLRCDTQHNNALPLC